MGFYVVWAVLAALNLVARAVTAPRMLARAAEADAGQRDEIRRVLSSPALLAISVGFTVVFLLYAFVMAVTRTGAWWWAAIVAALFGAGIVQDQRVRVRVAAELGGWSEGPHERRRRRRTAGLVCASVVAVTVGQVVPILVPSAPAATIVTVVLMVVVLGTILAAGWSSVWVASGERPGRAS